MDPKDNNKTIDVTPSQKSASSLVLPIVLGSALVLSLGGNLYLSNRTNKLNSDVETLRSEVSSIKSTVSQSQETVSKNLEQVRENLTATKDDITKKVDVARYVAQKSAATVDAKISKDLAEQDKKFGGQIDQVRAATEQVSEKLTTSLTSANGEIGGLKTDVGGVKADVAATRSELERTIGDLKRMRGDMGEMSGLIATNGKELAALKELGDRTYWEFSLPKSGTVQKVGDMQMMLKKLDAKRNRYTVEVVIDDKHIEKKDKTINEPVQFYSNAKLRQPFEVVVYDIGKDKVTGYLAAPKVQVARK